MPGQSAQKTYGKHYNRIEISEIDLSWRNTYKPNYIFTRFLSEMKTYIPT